MNISQMKNMIILKDLPSNIVDEAIVILKNNAKIKNREKIENKNPSNFREKQTDEYGFVIKEAEYIIQDYIKGIESPKIAKSKTRDINIKYKRLQISSFLLGITAIVGIILSIVR